MKPLTYWIYQTISASYMGSIPYFFLRALFFHIGLPCFPQNSHLKKGRAQLKISSMRVGVDNMEVGAKCLFVGTVLFLSALDVRQIRFIEIPLAEAGDLRIIQPAHNQFNQLSLGFFGKKENQNDPGSLNACRVFHPGVIQELTTPSPLVPIKDRPAAGPVRAVPTYRSKVYPCPGKTSASVEKANIAGCAIFSMSVGYG
jgi:hypothetical protein